jgi:glycosyltransferase involved in cell wall biosynthesis
MESRLISLMHFTNSTARGGAEEHILTLLRGLDRQIFRLHLVCPDELAQQMRADLPQDVELIPLTLRRPTQVGAALRFAGLLRNRQVQILHSHLFYSSLFASPVGRVSGVPLIIETPHINELWRHGWVKGSYIIDRFAGRFVDYYVAVSHANAEYLVQHKRLPAGKVVVIRNGCDLRRFENPESRAGTLKKTLGFGVDDPVLVHVGRLEPQKGHQVLLEALTIVRREFPDVRLVCVGEGALRGEIEQRSRSLGLEPSVRLVGFQRNIPEWLALADMVVLPSFFEGLPIAAIESLAASKAVVATAVDGTPEVIIHGKTGLTVPPGNPAALAEAIGRLLGDSEVRKSMGEAGRKWVQENFSQEQQVHKTTELYLQGLARKRRRVRVTNAGVARQDFEAPSVAVTLEGRK